MNKRPLAPGFLNRLDRKLLLNRPDTWSTRLHLVVYYVLLFAAAVTLICFVAPSDPREYSFAPFWCVGIGLLSFMGLIVWLIYLLRFNVFKQFGKVHPGDRLKTFLAYYLTVMLIAVVVYIPLVVEKVRADMAYTSDELATDMNRMNELVCRLEYNSLPKKWTPDTLVLREHYDYSSPMPPSHYTYLDSSAMRSTLETSDSIVKINDTMSVRWHFFNLVFISHYRVTGHTEVPIYGTKGLYYLVFRNHRDVNQQAAQKELQGLIDKYEGEREEYWYDNTELYWRIKQKYGLNGVDNSISNIASRKYQFEHGIDDFARSTHYVVLAITLLIFVFRHCTIRTFFLTLLTLVILSILTSLVVAMIDRWEECISLAIMLVYFAALFIYALSNYKTRVRSVFKGIALNIVVLATAVVPIMAVGLYYTIQYRYYYQEYYPYYYDWHPNRELHYLLAEIGGVVILLVLVETLYKRLYRSWYAAPEE